MKRLATVVMAGLIVFMLASIRVSANPLYGVPYDTYTLGADGRLIPTQTAYLPVGQFGTAGLSPGTSFITRGLFMWLMGGISAYWPLTWREKW